MAIKVLSHRNKWTHSKKSVSIASGVSETAFYGVRIAIVYRNKLARNLSGAMYCGRTMRRETMSARESRWGGRHYRPPHRARVEKPTLARRCRCPIAFDGHLTTPPLRSPRRVYLSNRELTANIQLCSHRSRHAIIFNAASPGICMQGGYHRCSRRFLNIARKTNMNVVYWRRLLLTSRFLRYVHFNVTLQIQLTTMLRSLVWSYRCTELMWTLDLTIQLSK